MFSLPFNIDIVYGWSRGYWFQAFRDISFAYKIIDIGFSPILFAIYKRY